MKTQLPLVDSRTPRLSSEAAKVSLKTALEAKSGEGDLSFETLLTLPEDLRMALYGDVMTYGPAAELIGIFFEKTNQKNTSSDDSEFFAALVRLGDSWQKSSNDLDGWNPRGRIRIWSEDAGFSELNQWFVNLGYKTISSTSNDVALRQGRGVTFMCWLFTVSMLRPAELQELVWKPHQDTADEVLALLDLPPLIR